MPKHALITKEQAYVLLRKTLKLRVKGSAIYYYVKFCDFPLPVGLGKPRRWKKTEVLDWIRKRRALRK
jgi:predicted DNA-binding transcriptional regulator AlpA